jgi:xylan 1,4-beta-xylosidase
MKPLIIFSVLFILLSGCRYNLRTENPEYRTICNPVNISYRFTLDSPSRREAADPTVAWFRDRYYLFASKSGGYWHSEDLAEWTFIETNQIPTEEYAPTVFELDDTLYFMASSTELSTIYKSGDPLTGKWTVAVKELEIPIWDPAFYVDDDKRLYLYWGCSNANPIYGVEIDYKNNFAFIGEHVELIHGNPKEHGWEVPGDFNTFNDRNPWIEGAWMTKKDGKYYLQYSGPGTEYKSYCDGVYVSDSPLGPYDLQPHNPFAYRPEGYTSGAGHGSTFFDEYGNLWHIGTITISQKHMFERRLGLFPAFIDEEGTLYSCTKYGDYPIIIPTHKINDFEEIFPGWMVLSFNKNVEVTSSLDSLPATNMTDEDIRTYWAAASGDANEQAILDLGEISDVYALQINFAEHNAGIFGREKQKYHRYTIDYSSDGTKWDRLEDKSGNETDNTHDYIQPEEKIACRFLKVTNVEVPGGHFAVSDFRVFGKGHGPKPVKINNFEATRDPADARRVNMTWEKSTNATGYNISFGSEKDKLYQNYMVYDDTTLTINSLNTNQDYYFSIESFNENGITASGVTLVAPHTIR